MAASAYSPSGVMSGLPSNHLLKSYTSMTSLITAARVVLGNLNQNNDAGNQYIVVLGLPKSIRTHLNEDKNALDGIGLRFMFEDAVGLIKIVPSYAHDATTSKVHDTMTIRMVGMGVPEDDIYRLGGNNDVQIDDRPEGQARRRCISPSAKTGAAWPASGLADSCD